MLNAAFIFLAPEADPAVHGRARVGSVRFDIHPGLGNKSGDEVFD